MDKKENLKMIIPDNRNKNRIELMVHPQVKIVMKEMSMKEMNSMIIIQILI
jgi:hypothetical protein